MLKSLKNLSSQPVQVLVLALDEDCFYLLQRLNLPWVRLIRLPDLQPASTVNTCMKNRNWTEFCWTLSSLLCRYCIRFLGWPEVTYLDADIFFHGDPETLFQKHPSHSTLITDHNYAPEYDQSAISGRYCVQFLRFTRHVSSTSLLDWWALRCIEDCPSIPKPGKFGDQKYLESFASISSEVETIQSWGAGLAPWNAKKFVFELDESQALLCGLDSPIDPLIFYHYHGFQILETGEIDLCRHYYAIPQFLQQHTYQEYVSSLNQICKDILNKNLGKFIRVEKDSTHPLKMEKRRRLGVCYRDKAPYYLRKLTNKTLHG